MGYDLGIHDADFAGIVPATRGTSPLPLDPLPSNSFPMDDGLEMRFRTAGRLTQKPRNDST